MKQETLNRKRHDDQDKLDLCSLLKDIAVIPIPISIL